METLTWIAGIILAVIVAAVLLFILAIAAAYVLLVLIAKFEKDVEQEMLNP